MQGETKPWYLSRTIWASAVVLATAGAGVFGLPVEDGDAAALTDAGLQAITAIAAIAAIVARIVARTRIA